MPAFVARPTTSLPSRLVGCLLLVLLAQCDRSEGVANNLHVYDGATTAEILGDDVFFEIIEPEELQYTYRLRMAKDFGVPFGESFKRHSHVLVPTDPADACNDIFNAEDMEGNIALIERGGCSFIAKSLRAEAAGAWAVIVTDTNNSSEDAEHYIEMIHDQTSADVDIPVGYLMGMNGQMIKKTMRRLRRHYAIINVPMNLTFTPPHHINHPPWVGW